MKTFTDEKTFADEKMSRCVFTYEVHPCRRFPGDALP